MSPPTRLGLGIVFLVSANGLTAVVDAVAKLLSTDMHPVQVVWGYFAAIAALLAAHAAFTRLPPRRLLATPHTGLQVARSGLLVATIVALFIGLTFMPLADTIAVTFMAPLFVTILAGPLLGEPVGARRVGAVLAGLVGVAVIVRPGGGLANWAVLLPLLSALTFALFQIATRRLATSVPVRDTLYHTGFGGLVWSSLVVWPFWTPMTPMDGAVFAALGVLGVGAHASMIKAFEAAPASLLAPYNYAKLVWGVILGYAMFGDVPGIGVIIGAVVIVASGLYVFWSERA